ncbi:MULTISPECIES: branched-chain amino acid ABC transporter permease [Streptacidiphilus]|uniref:Branched-chain amino acid ABC transporter permease n=2 Tax=Streptacidiphilus TaxID=228398 RepID=A0ABV6UQM3_9ACTN|nr:branched-chain amino acid ABC transporter permease [Streptacidiphilus jeojiense]
MTDTINTQQTPALRPALPLPEAAARGLAAVGGLATAASAFLAWTYSSAFPGDLTVNGYPGGLQWVTLVAGLLVLLYALTGYRVPGLRWLAPGGAEGATVIVAFGALATTWFTLIAIADELGGLANLASGGWVAGIASLVALLGALGLPRDGVAADADNPLKRVVGYPGKRPDLRPAPALPVAVELLIITLALALGLGIFTFGIDTSYGELFGGFLITAVFAAWALSRSGALGRLTDITSRHRVFTAVGAFVAAAIFPFTQNSDANASIGVNLLIFGATALGLNVVVGLTGLLDLGYVAFLGVGAYTGALVSGAATSSLHVTFPFWAAAITGAAVSGIFGVILGAPTLRVRGDYLAIVTLGFGEIFRIVVNNLDGVSGPNVTGGPNGIPNIPDLSIFGFNLGNAHTIGGITLGRFANYFELMLVFIAIIVLVFSRSSSSRIGRAWVAIREDETAATAMGINAFRFKLLAFALGATLAGLAGTVMAHVGFSVVPDPFVFAGPVPPNSAFLLAAVVIGGMGTVTGPLIGAALFYLLQAKLQFLQSYQLLLFGIALILFMRFRPEGLIANKQRQLEFHEDETESAAELSTAGA